jgi:O-succinylbenzoic acid--CoA ligase
MAQEAGEMTVGTCIVAASARQAPDAPAIVHPGGALSYAALDALAADLCGRLAAGGVAQGSVVAFSSEASARYLAALVATWRLGAIALPLNPKFPPAYTADRIREQGAIRGEDLIAAPVPREAIPLHMAGGGVLILTSGSTGTPKAAMLPLRALLANAQRANQNIPLGPGDRWLLSLPLFHVSGLGVVLRAWSAGAAVALPAPGESIVSALTTLAPTHVSLVATQLQRLLPDAAACARLRGATAILLGGSAMPEAMIRAAHVAALPIHKSYGLTEMASQVATTRPGAGLDELMTSGPPLAPGTLRISREGEIEVRGETLFAGYRQPDATLRLPLSGDGWFATGDLGRLDGAGRLVVLGRRDSMYICGGENVHPEEVERALLGALGVEQAVVFGVPDAEFVNAGFAFVRMAPGAAFDATGLRDALRASLPGFKIPRHVHAWPDDGGDAALKPSRATLRARALALLA